jgi:hypothetical protein
MAVALTKMSFLCFCLRVFPRRELRTTLYTLLAVSTAYGLAFTLTCIFNCTPISYIWQNWDGEHSGKCINFHIFGWVHAGINIVLDVVIISVPIPELSRLSMSVRNKVQFVLMFSIGALYVLVLLDLRNTTLTDDLKYDYYLHHPSSVTRTVRLLDESNIRKCAGSILVRTRSLCWDLLRLHAGYAPFP